VRWGAERPDGYRVWAELPAEATQHSAGSLRQRAVLRFSLALPRLETRRIRGDALKISQAGAI
jgi:hypothetical protein